MYDALDVAKYIINYERSRGRTVSNLRLQKLLYFVQAQFLVTTQRACFCDEMEAWDFGPVVPNVYHVYKAYGSSSLPRSLPVGANITFDDSMLINRIIKRMQRTRWLILSLPAIFSHFAVSQKLDRRSQHSWA